MNTATAETLVALYIYIYIYIKHLFKCLSRGKEEINKIGKSSSYIIEENNRHY